MATISGGDVSALPPVHLWLKQPGGNYILVAGRNRLEAHKRSGREVIIARVITSETPETARAVRLIGNPTCSKSIRRLLAAGGQSCHESLRQ